VSALARPIDDRELVRTLRHFVVAAGPVLGVLAGPALAGTLNGDDKGPSTMAGRLARVAVRPAAGSVQERAAWWVQRVGRLTAVLAASPGLAGPAANPARASVVLASAGQGLVLCGIAGEHAVDDRDVRVRLLADVVLRRRIDPAELDVRWTTADEAHGSAASPPAADGPRALIASVGQTAWQLGTHLYALSGELQENRGDPTRKRRLLGRVPGVAVVDGYLSGYRILEQVAEAGTEWLSRRS
jgi:hypothetical protein